MGRSETRSSPGSERDPEHGAMELREWAQTLVTQPSLAAKLWAPSTLIDRAPHGSAPIPNRPARPAELRMVHGRAEPPPRDSALDDPVVRAHLLHQFANHELLAIELMALALLRFADAPPAFRRGLAQALREEQMHLRLYLERMRSLGVEFGAHELNGFFWRVMAPMPSPLDFVAHMALTFEQANLDFSSTYAARMRAVGDDESAAVLDRVYADEIGHVKLGVVWFERWRERGPSLLEAHARALREPITARRARGLGFDHEARSRAGLPDDYIGALRDYEASRGRPPAVYLFDPTTELSLAAGQPVTPPTWLRALADDLAIVPAVLARREDIVLVPKRPSAEHRRVLAEAGVVLPRLCVEPGGEGQPDALDRWPSRVAELRPWGWSPQVRRRWKHEVGRVDRPPPPAEHDAWLHSKVAWAERSAELLDGLTDAGVATWLAGPDTRGVVAHDGAQLDAALAELRSRGAVRAVIKAPYGTAGAGAQRVDSQALTAPQRGWAERTLSRQGAVLVEPWLDRVCDLSLRIDVTAQTTRTEGLSCFVTDRAGRFLGAWLGPLGRTVPASVARWLHDDGRDRDRVSRVMHRVGDRVAQVVVAAGYRGRVGIDALVFRDREGALRLRPLVEVNVRPTFGHIASAIERKIARGTRGLFVLVPVVDLAAGVGPTAVVERVQRVVPRELAGPPGGLRRGALVLNDPSQARHMLALAVVGAPREVLLEGLRSVAPSFTARIESAAPPHER